MIPSDIFLSIGWLTMYWYGIFVALGIAACYAISIALVARYGKDLICHFDRAFAITLIPGTIGARILYVLYHLSYFRLHPTEVIALWHGGWVWQGGVATGILAACLYCRKARVSFFTLADLCVPGIALGQAIGRIGNYFNQEAYGAPTNLPWGIPIDLAHRIPGYEWATHFHPTFAYEGVFNVVLAGILVYLALRGGARWGIGSGVVFLLWLLLYSLGRFAIEFLRIDTVPMILGLRAPQWMSVIFLCMAGVKLFSILAKKKNA